MDHWRGKVVSGGQTGVDRAALDAAMEAGLACGGFVPKGRLAEDGRVPERYPLTECEVPDYPVRTERNVVNSSATLILTRGRLNAGTLLTYELCLKHKKPACVIDLRGKNLQRAAKEANQFLLGEKPAVLNVAGPRESKCPGIYAQSLELLKRVFSGPVSIF